MKHAVLGLALAAVMTLGTASAFAQDASSLATAKAHGLIGETQNGFVAAVAPSPSPEIAAMVEQVNAARLANYREVAARNGTPLEQVESLAGAKLIDLTPTGQFVQDANGKWVHK